MYALRRKVAWFAVTSRMVILGLQFLFNSIIPDYNPRVFISPMDPTDTVSNYDLVIDKLFSGLFRWDAQYFLHIAKYGYTYDNVLAFFPLYPLIVRYLSMILRPVLFVCNQHSVILISAVLVNFIFFVKSAVILLDLSSIVLKNEKLAYKAVILYCINPASIFFSAFYSESTFAYLSFYTMLAYAKNSPHIYFPIGLSTIVRSNGLVNIGFPIFLWLRSFLHRIFSSNRKKRSTIPVPFSCTSMTRSFWWLLNIIILSVIPHVLLQIYNYSIFCSNGHIQQLDFVRSYGERQRYLIAGQDHPLWCNYTIPTGYFQVQGYYWKVGFMSYYKLRKIPFFVLAFPMLYIILIKCTKYLIQHKGGLYILGVTSSKRDTNSSITPDLFVFVIHGLFLTIVCILFVHIEVTTRLLSSASPLLYWYCAMDLSNDETESSSDLEHIDDMSSRWKVFIFSQRTYTTYDKIILLYFLGYLVIGCLVFSNFMRWT